MNTSVVAQLLPAGIFGIFDFMEAAERIIKERAETCSPNMARRIRQDAFAFLCPCEKLQRLTSSSRVYRAHCHELLDRFEQGMDLRPATAAEILASMSAFSLTVVLNDQGRHVYFRAFERVFGQVKAEEMAGDGLVDFRPHTDFDREELEDEWRRLEKKLGDPTRS